MPQVMLNGESDAGQQNGADDVSEHGGGRPQVTDLPYLSSVGVNRIVPAGPWMRMEPAFAFHEAGHAVIAQFFGMTVTRVELRENGGLCRYRSNKNDPAESVILALAGHAAVRHAFPEHYKPISLDELASSLTAVRQNVKRAGRISEAKRFRHLTADASDEGIALHWIVASAPGATDEQVIAMFREGEQSAAHLMTLRAVWGPIEAVTAALLERSVITGAELAMISATMSTMPSRLAG